MRRVSVNDEVLDKLVKMADIVERLFPLSIWTVEECREFMVTGRRPDDKEDDTGSI